MDREERIQGHDNPLRPRVTRLITNALRRVHVVVRMIRRRIMVLSTAEYDGVALQVETRGHQLILVPVEQFTPGPQRDSCRRLKTR